MKTFAGIDERYATFDAAGILLQPIPYDGTSSWGKGADKGFAAFIEASENMELYDIETDSEVYRQGIHIMPAITEDSSPEAVCAAVRSRAHEMLDSGKLPTFFGGEHSVGIGAIQAFHERHPDITILQLDAHADLRPSYAGSECNHACAAHWASQNANLVQVGIRSMDAEEKKYLKAANTFFAADIHGDDGWIDDSIALMGDKVYITIDLDVLDPSIMPATGTPEPGGLDWNTTIGYLGKVFRRKNVLGFDIVELAPIVGLNAPNFLVSKLYYKLLSYRFRNEENGN